jgi:uncharacterized metal-binding protein
MKYVYKIGDIVRLNETIINRGGNVFSKGSKVKIVDRYSGYTLRKIYRDRKTKLCQTISRVRYLNATLIREALL